MAGLSAARRLAALGVDFTVLEAKRRIGGRAHTDRAVLGLPFDLGCHWLHSADRNPLTRIAAAFGFTAVPNRLIRRIHGGTAGRRMRSATTGRSSSGRSGSAWTRPATRGGDMPAGALLDRSHRWSGLYESWFGMLNGATPGAVSTLDLARYGDSGDNRQVREGLGTLVARYGTGIPVRLGAPVRAIRWGGAGVEVEGSAGRLRARAAIVTVSTTALGWERIRFEPHLPPDLVDAFDGLQLGHALRIAVRFPAGTFEDLRCPHAMFADDSASALAFQVQPFGRPMVTAYAGAGHARELEGGGLEAVRALVVERLGAMFGSAVTRNAGKAVMSGWAADPDIGGAYSFARPGGGALRVRLAAPLADRLWFAGEAASRHGFSTAHGAWESGRRAADEVAAAMGRSAPVPVAHPRRGGAPGRTYATLRACSSAAPARAAPSEAAASATPPFP